MWNIITFRINAMYYSKIVEFIVNNFLKVGATRRAGLAMFCFISTHSQSYLPSRL